MDKDKFIDFAVAALEAHEDDDNKVKGIEFMGVDRDDMIVSMDDGSSFLIRVRNIR